MSRRTTEDESQDIAERTLRAAEGFDDLLMIGGSSAIAAAAAVLLVRGDLSGLVAGAIIVVFGGAALFRFRARSGDG